MHTERPVPGLNETRDPPRHGDLGSGHRVNLVDAIEDLETSEAAIVRLTAAVEWLERDR